MPLLVKAMVKRINKKKKIKLKNEKINLYVIFSSNASKLWGLLSSRRYLQSKTSRS